MFGAPWPPLATPLSPGTAETEHQLERRASTRVHAATGVIVGIKGRDSERSQRQRGHQRSHAHTHTHARTRTHRHTHAHGEDINGCGDQVRQLGAPTVLPRRGRSSHCVAMDDALGDLTATLRCSYCAHSTTTSHGAKTQ